MDSGDKPMSIKDRIAKFQNLISNSSESPPKGNNPSTNSSANQKPIIKPSQPSPPQQKFTGPPANKHGQVESASITKPSAVRQSWQQNTINIQNQTPKQPIKQQQTNNIVSNPPPTVKQSVPSVDISKSPQGNNDEDKVLSPMMIKQMLEGKVMNMNRQSYPVNPKSIIPKTQEQRGTKEAPVVITNVEVGNVKGNTQKLNMFFENQNLMTEIGAKKKSQKEQELIVSPPSTKEENYKGNTQNIVAGTEFSAPPGLNQSPSKGTSEPQGTSLSPTKGQEESLVARLKKKKRTREAFSSDEN